MEHKYDNEVEDEQQQREQQRDQHEQQQSASGIPSFRNFDRSGIVTENPFQSRKDTILGKSTSAATRKNEESHTDRFAMREAVRRREREDELYFNTKYAGVNERRQSNEEYDEEREEDAGARSDGDYAFLRHSHSDLPLQHLSRGQRQTAREIAEEDADAASSERRGRARTRQSGGMIGAEDVNAATSSSGPRSSSATRASDAELLSTIEYLESFLSRSKRDLSLKRAASEGPAEWRIKLEEMGGPEQIGRYAKGLAASKLYGDKEGDVEHLVAATSKQQDHRERSPSPVTRNRVRYASPTVSSSPFTPRASPFAASAAARRPRSASRGREGSPLQLYAAHPDEELALVRLETEMAALRRQASNISSSGQKPHQQLQQRQQVMDVVMSDMRKRGDMERSIAYLEDYTQGRRSGAIERTEEELWGPTPTKGRSSSIGRLKQSPRPASASVSARPSPTTTTAAAAISASPHTPTSRIPSSHPHKTGKNHVPASCIYCTREMDWNAVTGAGTGSEMMMIKAIQEAFPERSEALGGGQRGSGTQSRLRPLAKRMMDTSRELSNQLPISADVNGHFLAQLSASARRSQSNRLDNLWYMIGNAERDRGAQLTRIAAEIEEEAFKRSTHMKWLEEQTIERTLGQTMQDRAAEREMQKMIDDQARHAASLLELKKQSLENYTRDQIDLLAERRRIEKETDKMRRQNERHSLREIQKQARESAENIKQRKLDQIRHAEEKYAFKLSQLKRPAFSERGVDDLAHWKVGRALNASM